MQKIGLQEIIIAVIVVVVGLYVAIAKPFTNEPVSFMPNADDVGIYNQLAASVGLQYGFEYRYHDWAEIKWNNSIGAAGHYETLGCVGAEWAPTAGCWKPEGDRFIEIMYYDNLDLTIATLIRHQDPSGFATTVAIAKGRQPDILE